MANEGQARVSRLEGPHSMQGASSRGKKPTTAVFVLGGPGSGRDTQIAKICQDYDFVHISVPDLLREEEKTRSGAGDVIAKYTKLGKIVPPDITLSLIQRCMEKHVKRRKHFFLINGFLQNMTSWTVWQKAMDPYTDVPFALFFDCPETIRQRRWLDRARSSGGGAGGQVNQGDENLSLLTTIFRIYLDSSMAVVDAFAEMGKLVNISSVPGPEEVYAEVQKALAPFKVCLCVVCKGV